MRLTCSIIVLIAVSTSLARGADDNAAVQQKLAAIFSGKEVTLRAPYSSSSLEFDEQGRCQKHCDQGGWAADGTVEVDRVNLHGNTLRLTGRRVCIVYNAGSRGAVPTGDYHLTISFHEPVSEASVDRALLAILRGKDDMVPNGPPPDENPLGYECKGGPKDRMCRVAGTNIPWRPTSEIDTPLRIEPTADGGQAFVFSKPLVPPKAIKTPDPEFPRSERQQGHSKGTVTFAVLVDTRGFVQSMQIDHASAPGFAAAAAQAVAGWTFHPATLKGQPVPVLIHVDVNFQIE